MNGAAAWRRRAALALLYLCALALGAGSAWWVLRRSPWTPQAIHTGAWTTTLLAGSPDADLYTRARIALDALLALGRDETMYYLARADDRGRPLRSACHYQVQGLPPAARWWSITAYADDMFLFDAPNRQYSLNGSEAKLDAQGRFSLVTGPSARPGVMPDAAPTAPEPRWLPTPGDRGVVLTLRLYHPAAAIQADPASLRAPSITALGDCP